MGAKRDKRAPPAERYILKASAAERACAALARQHGRERKAAAAAAAAAHPSASWAWASSLNSEAVAAAGGKVKHAARERACATLSGEWLQRARQGEDRRGSGDEVPRPRSPSATDVCRQREYRTHLRTVHLRLLPRARKKHASGCGVRGRCQKPHQGISCSAPPGFGPAGAARAGPSLMMRDTERRANARSPDWPRCGAKVSPF